VIAGGGPAGSSLAIRLARSGYDVTLLERAKFPRQKLCGEFVSPECLDHFGKLGVIEEMLSSGGDRISETVFFSLKGRSASVPSSWFGVSGQKALGISRARMDLLLLEEAKRAGAEVIEDAAVTGAVFEEGLAKAVQVRLGSGDRPEIPGDLFIDATGRHRALARYAPGTGQELVKPGLVGFKAHHSSTSLPHGRCEIYFFPGGYGGLNYVEGGAANHCFLVSSNVAKEFGGNADSIVEELVLKNSRARDTLSGAVREHDWLAVAVEGFGGRDVSPVANLFAVGDAGAFIDPFTGSGMLMALESSEILASLLVSGSLAETAREYRRSHRTRFRRRLAICAAMRRLAFSPGFAEIAVSAAGLSSGVRRLLAKNTRSGPRTHRA